MPKKKLIKGKKYYILVGSNNFWYAVECTLKDAMSHRKKILNGKDCYADPETGYKPETPEEVFVYKANEVFYR